MSSLVLAKFMTILLVLAHASMLLNSVSKSVSESSGTKRVESMLEHNDSSKNKL